jgi:hypothetical protein
MSNDPKLGEALEAMGRCMAHISELDDELHRSRFTIWFQRAIALLSLSVAIASMFWMLGYIREGHTWAAGLSAGAGMLNAWAFGSVIWRVESMVHEFRKLRARFSAEADRLAGIIGPLVLAQSLAAEGGEKAKYTTICTIIPPTDGVN